MRKIFYTPEFPASAQSIAAAKAAGAGEIIQGVGGYVEIPDPDPVAAPVLASTDALMAAMVSQGIVTQEQAQGVIAVLTDPDQAEQVALDAQALTETASPKGAARVG